MRRWVLLEKDERVRKGDKVFDWNSEAFVEVDNAIESPKFGPLFVKDGEHVIRRIVIPARHLCAANLCEQSGVSDKGSGN